jgi:DNA polymerase-3 subunit alpha
MLRKAMGKKDPKVMAKQREAFMTGAKTKGVNEKKATKIFDLMEYFAGYGFNKSHSTTYAWVAYQTGYLKANFPRHFMAALLTIEAANTEKLAMYLGECRDLGVPILPPDVNASELQFTVTSDGVRFGLCAVKNVGEGAVQSILAVRRELGGLDSLFTLCEHVDLRLVNKRVLESLVKAGALDSLAPDDTANARRARGRLFAAIDKAIEHGNRDQRDREKGQHQLFGGPAEDGTPSVVPLADGVPWAEAFQLAGEKEALGFYMSGHPLERFADDLKTFGARRVAELTESLPDVWTAGIVSGLRPLKTKKGDRMAVFMCEDVAGNLEVVVFPECFGKHGSVIEADAMVLVRGKFEKDDESARIVASELLPISTLQERTTKEVAIHLSVPPHGRPTFEALAELLSRHRGDRRVFLELDVRGKEKPLRVRSEVAVRVKPSERLVTEVEQLCGSGSVELR